MSTRDHGLNPSMAWKNEQASLEAERQRIKNSEKQDTINSINEIWQRVDLMGANDMEKSFFSTLISQLESGKISPSDALAMAQKTESDKMDYH